MITIEKLSMAGLEPAIRGMRNPKNSWHLSDSHYPENNERKDIDPYTLGPNDYKLAASLASGGPCHAKYRRMIVCWMDITAPLYWWKEFDTYKVGTVSDSCSTMHKIQEKPFKQDMFSHEHLYADSEHSFIVPGEGCLEDWTAMEVLNVVILALNSYREKYLAETNPEIKKRYWWQMIQLLPTSYNQKRTIMLSYENLYKIYNERKNHKQDEWRIMCNWIEGLPYSELITDPRSFTLYADNKPIDIQIDPTILHKHVPAVERD